MTAKKKNMTSYQPITGFKGYARFHSTFLGFHLYDNQKKRIRPKYVLWAVCRRLCEEMSYKGEVIEGFTLVKKRKSSRKKTKR